jgi:hypothetical protein
MLTADITTIELGRLCSPNATTTSPRHQLLRLRDKPLIVLPYARCRGGWECFVVASRLPRARQHLHLGRCVSRLQHHRQTAAHHPAGRGRPATRPDHHRRLPAARQQPDLAAHPADRDDGPELSPVAAVLLNAIDITPSDNGVAQRHNDRG